MKRSLCRLVALLLVCAVPAGAIPRTDRSAADSKLPSASDATLPSDPAAVAAGAAAASSEAITPCVAGFAGTYPCSKVDLLAYRNLAFFGATAGNDIWGWTDLTTGKEYALVGLNTGTAFLDITDPVNPVYLGRLPTQTSNSTWRDIKTYADHAFIVSEASGHGMQVFDLTQLRTVVSPPVTFSNTAWYSGIGSSHNVAINEATGFAYVVGAGACSGGLHMVDIRDPANPVFAGCFSADGYTHDAQIVVYRGPDAAYQGHEVAFACNEDTITIVDVTDKSAPVQLSRTGYPQSAYTHQGWLTPDQKFFLQDDELDEQNFGGNTRTRIWNVQDLNAPFIVGTYTGATAAIDHNLYTRGNYTFESNYRAGLRILSNTNLPSGSLTETGYFDIYPASNTASFNGAWSVYPYFPSGVVVVDGIEQGLFILDPSQALGGGTVTGTVEDGAASPIMGATVRAGVGDDAPTLFDGTYGIRYLLPGTYDVEASAPGFEPSTVTGVTVTEGGTTSGVDFTLSPGTASISGRALRCGETDHSGTLVTVVGAGSALTNAAGEYSLGGLVSGTYDVVATYAGFTTEQASVSLAVAEAATGVDFTLLNTGAVSVSQSPNLAIPDNNPTGVTAVMNVADAIVPSEVDVQVNLTHTYIGDLIVELRSPLGTTVRLHNRSGGSADNILTTYDDLTAPDGPGTMAAFTGVSATGNWSLFVSDNAGIDVGTLNSWTMLFQAPEPCNPVVAVTPTPPAARFQLSAPQPNPFVSSTSIAFSLPSDAPVSLAVYNLLGQRVAQLIDGPRPAGAHRVTWSGRDDSGKPVTSGIYFVRLVAPGHRATQRMSLVR